MDDHLSLIHIFSLFSSVFGVSSFRISNALEERRRPYFFTTSRACSEVEESGAAGPDAMLSKLLPRTSDRTMAVSYTHLAIAHFADHIHAGLQAVLFGVGQEPGHFSTVLVVRFIQSV